MITYASVKVRACRRTSNPSNPGRLTSRTTTSGDRSRIALEGGRSVGGRDHVHALRLEVATDEVDDRDLVVDDEDAGGGHGDPTRERDRGHRPVRLRDRRARSCRRGPRRSSGRWPGPSPVPDGRISRARVPRYSRSKSRSRSVSSSPMPVSSTRTMARPSRTSSDGGRRCPRPACSAPRCRGGCPNSSRRRSRSPSTIGRLDAGDAHPNMRARPGAGAGPNRPAARRARRVRTRGGRPTRPARATGDRR